MLMTEILAEVLRLDEAGQYQEIINCLLRQSIDPATILSGLAHLLKHQRFTAARYLGSALVRVGVEDPMAHLGRAIGGMMMNDRDVEVDSTASLAQLYDALPPERQSLFYTEILNPTLFSIAARALGSDDGVTLLRVLEILKAGAPEFRQIFDWSAGATSLLLGDDQRARLITYRSPPEGAPRVGRRTVVALRERMFPQIATSRMLDIGPRFADAASRYGWPATFCPLAWDPRLDFQTIFDSCRECAADVLIIDDDFIQNEATHAPRQQLIAALRQALPSIRIVALYLDSWQIAPDFLRRMAPDVDALWATTPAMPHWRDAVFAGKVLQAPLAHACNLRPPDAAAPTHISFVGGLMGYNWHRVFWRAAAIRERLPIDWQLSTHVTDGLPPLESHAGYMRRLAASGCSLNLSMRPDLSRVITDRSFETLLAGTLLVQEAAPDLDHFLVAGEHYLAFSSFADLRAVASLVETQPETIRAIRHAGHEFAAARYADEKLIGYLDALLFHPMSC
jgi:hypothetical protein